MRSRKPTAVASQKRQAPTAPPKVAEEKALVERETTSADGALDFMWQAFGNLNEWVRFSDTKTAAVLAADGVIVSALATVLVGSKPHILETWPVILWVTLVMLAAFYSATFALGALMPQLRISRKPAARPTEPTDEADSSEESSSLVFFMDIDKKFPTAREFHATINEALTNPDRAVNEITQQIWANSKVAAVKYHRVTMALYGLLVSIVVGFCGALGLAVYAFARAIYGS